MRYLLDIHALIWWWLKDPKLSTRAAAVIASEENEIYVSSVSAFEIANKVRVGQLPMMIEPLRQFEGAVQEEGLRHLPMHYDHARQAGLMRADHRDPFDRMIAAQALIENLTVVTRDRQIGTFGCETLW